MMRLRTALLVLVLLAVTARGAEPAAGAPTLAPGAGGPPDGSHGSTDAATSDAGHGPVDAGAAAAHGGHVTSKYEEEAKQHCNMLNVDYNQRQDNPCEGQPCSERSDRGREQ
jgi:hypothetical protein